MVPLALASIGAMLLFAAGAAAQAIPPQPVQWSVVPDFGKSKDARENISGAACAPTQPPLRACLVVNDQKKYAQLFSIAGTILRPGALVRLLSRDADGDPDGEGAAYADGYFYVVGSHGRGRKGNKLRHASFLVFRFPANTHGNAGQELTPAVQTSTKLRQAIRDAEFLGPFAEQPLNANGANIEGMAADSAQLYFGFRGPSLEGRAFILSVALDGLFGGQPLAAKVHALSLGSGVGIRDLARVDDGLLVLAGPATQQAVPASIFRWHPTTGALEKLGDLGGLAPGAKAETLLVLGSTEQHYKVLVMFDGVSNGGPREYFVPILRRWTLEPEGNHKTRWSKFPF